jgi:hypothetical protein
MCARRFLIAIFFLTLLAVAAAFAIFQWGGGVLIEQAVPQGHFQAPAGETAPDYSKPDSWVSNSELPPTNRDDPAQWLPNGVTQNALGDASIFYIHPTTYLSRDRWNAPLHAGGDTEFRTSLFVKSQASAFNLAGTVWAPRYRQASYGTFLLSTNDARQALDLAYRDVKSAFAEFLKQAPRSGGIILAGHSQGALHLERLLREEVAGKPIAKRIIAAYVVGWPISERADLPLMGLRACQRAKQTGCLLSWMTFAQPANPDMIFAGWEKSAGLTGSPRNRADVLCTNPLTGTRNGAAGPQVNPGTLVPSADFNAANLLPSRVGARCEGGLLLIDGDVPPLGPYVLPGNNYHVYDYALFWGAIRKDATRRLAAWNNDHHE